MPTTPTGSGGVCRTGEGLPALGWTEKDLSQRRKGDKGKVKLAKRVRGETTMTLRWIADRLPMGSGTCVWNLLREKQ